MNSASIVGTDSSRPARLLAYLTGPQKPVGWRVVADDRPDAVFLCTRHGGEHAAQAVPLLEAGVSVWVDKPLALREIDAQAMIRAAADRRVVLACRSGLRAAAAVPEAVERLHRRSRVEITGPAEVDGPYGGLAHYGSHHVELACELAHRAGWEHPLTVDDVATAGADVRARLSAGETVVELVFRPPADCAGFTIAVDGRGARVHPPDRYLEDQAREFLAAVRAGRGTPDAESLLAPVRILAAILR